MDTAICTLAVGKKTEPRTRKLIESVKENTGCEVYVYAAESTIDYDKVIPIKEITEYPLRIKHLFNYNLKAYVAHHCYNNTDHERIIFSDCDVRITKQTNMFECLFTQGDICVMHEKFGHSHKSQPTWEKYLELMELLDLDDFYVGMKYFNECFMIYNRNERTTEFLENWKRVCEVSNAHWINSTFECVEMGIAEHLTKDLVVQNFKGGVLKSNHILVTEHRLNDMAVIRK